MGVSAACVLTVAMAVAMLACSPSDAAQVGHSHAPNVPAMVASAQTMDTGADTGTDARANAGKDSLLVTPVVYDGWKSFHAYCYSCHGADAVASDIAPDLRNAVGPHGAIAHDVFAQVVMNGRTAKGMPAWSALLDSAQVEHIYAYLVARGSGDLAPGQPHTK